MIQKGELKVYPSGVNWTQTDEFVSNSHHIYLMEIFVRVPEYVGLVEIDRLIIKLPCSILFKSCIFMS